MHEDPSPRLNPFRTAPNLLTLLRICIAPFLVDAILEGRFALSFGLFIAAGLTDALDGTLDQYQALYLTDRHVSRAASAKISGAGSPER